jgi:hypothetical protein
MSASLALLFGRNKYAQGQVGNVVFDTVITEDHRFNSRVTYYPVETGTLVSDHIINQPDVVVLQGLVSDTPLNALALFNRSIQAFNQLVRLHERREVVTVVTGLKVYPSMAITSMNVPRNIRTGQSLTFTVELQRVVFDTSVRLFLDTGNTAAGVTNVIPRTIVSSNSQIPILQFDPVDSLKDQASTASDLGVQSLQRVATSILPNVFTIQNIIAAAR